MGCIPIVISVVEESTSVVTVIRICGLALGNDLIARSMVVLIRFRPYNTTVFL